MKNSVRVTEDGSVRIGATDAQELFSFVHIADGHLRAPDPALPWTQEMTDRMLEAIRRTNALRPDFVVSTGDNLDAYSDENIAHLRRVYEMFRMPVHVVLGNHDVGIRSIDTLKTLLTDDVALARERDRIQQARRHNTAVPREATLRDDEHGMLQSSQAIRQQAIRRWNDAFGLPQRNRSFDVMGVHLVFFNFERHGIDDAEIEWIEADVGANKESPSLLFFHVPLPIPSLTREVEARIGSDICLARGPNTDRFFRLLAGNPQILAIFCSHVHFNSVHRHGGTVQITTDRVTEDALRRVIVHGMGA